jgi:hypothetical protein
MPYYQVEVLAFGTGLEDLVCQYRYHRGCRPRHQCYSHQRKFFPATLGIFVVAQETANAALHHLILSLPARMMVISNMSDMCGTRNPGEWEMTKTSISMPL